MVVAFMDTESWLPGRLVTRKNSVLAGSLTVIMMINVHFTVCKALRCILLFELRGDILGHDLYAGQAA